MFVICGLRFKKPTMASEEVPPSDSLCPSQPVCPILWIEAEAARLGHKPNVSVFAVILPRRYLAGFLCQGAIGEGVANPLDEISINNASEIHSLQDRKNSLYIKGRNSEFWCINNEGKIKKDVLAMQKRPASHV